MSETTAHPSRPVPLIATLFILALFAAFYVVVRRYYEPVTVAPQNAMAENLSKDLAWKATPASRRKELADLREAQTAQATTYGWIDQKAGTVRLPIEKAMELTARQYGAKK